MTRPPIVASRRHALLVALFVALPACAREARQDALRPEGPFARDADRL